MTELTATLVLALIALIGVAGQALEGAARMRNRWTAGMADDFWPED